MVGIPPFVPGGYPWGVAGGCLQYQIPDPPIMEKMIDENGLATQAWADWFQVVRDAILEIQTIECFYLAP